ncbi:MAG: sigma-54 dependent transcriptional regulator [Desulfovermiculus sp.]|nr:sigma-54 dependent transcriptional regulator [Desulfovermiculus sp.]
MMDHENHPARILVVDDEKRMRHLLAMMLEGNGYQVYQAEDGQEALERLHQDTYDLVIADIKMPRLDGHGLLKQMKDKGIDLPMVFITAFASVESAVEAMQQGVVDYISKPFDQDRILLTVQRSLNLSRIMAENKELKQEIQKIAGEEELIYTSRLMHQTMETAASVAEEDSTVLIRGESGTGKELLARFIHRSSHRCKGRFVPVNCAAIPAGLMESELFGHEKGAFTNADRRSIGKFEYASKGTLFLDEIGDMPLEAQAKLLRVLQEKKVQRVGGKEEIPVNARIVCATNQSLEDHVQQGKFRSDLLYRINVFPIELPPLRERKEDIPVLVSHFLSRFNAGTNLDISPQAEDMLHRYSWPGNVRDLANVMERACILARRSGRIESSHLSFLQNAESATPRQDFSLPPHGIDLEELEMDLVEQALEQADENQSAAARLLGLTRAKFRVLHKQYQQNRQKR